MVEEKNITHFGAIFLLNSILKGIVEYGLIPLLIIKFGFVNSLIFTFLFLLVFGLISIKIYDFYRTDYLMIESLKESEKNKTIIKGQNKILKIIIKWANKNKFLLGLILSSQNSGLLIIYYRKGSHLYNGFDKNLILIFLRNILILSLYLNILLYIGHFILK